MKKSTNIPFLNIENIEKDEDVIVILREWLKCQPHLPQLTDEHLQLFYDVKKPSIERTKELIDLHFTMKTLSPEFFINRDPKLNEKHLRNVLVYAFDKDTIKDHLVLFSRLKDNNVANFEYTESIKCFLIQADYIYSLQEKNPKGVIVVVDMAQMTLAHLSKFNLLVFKKYADYVQEGLYFKLKAIHVINTQPFIEKLMALTRPFLKAWILKILHFHGPVSDMKDIIPAERFPSEYGGKKSIFQDADEQIECLLKEETRQWFQTEEKLRVNEKLRLEASKDCGSVFGLQGSIRKLEID